MGILRKMAASAAAIAVSVCACASDGTAAVEALASRIVPSLSHRIEFNLQESSCTANWYEFEASRGRLTVSGDCVNSLAMGLGDYLRDFCKVTLTWFAADPVAAPSRLPSTGGKVRREAVARDRFFLNYCTFGYTIGWWNWRQWERLIDWMALNGVTMALANTGQESVWQKVWMEMGLTQEQTLAYFPGPSYLSWHRMTNLEGWHGPLPQSWLDAQMALQKQIIERENSLGIAPILSSFTGRVPSVLKDIYPQADIRKLRDWGGLPTQYNPWYLSPTDSLYFKIQKIYLETQKQMYGQDTHVYGIDLFNEVDPPYWEAGFLRDVASNTWKTLEACDPDAVWLQMSWLFYYRRAKWTNDLIEAYLSPVPKGHLLMLDYYCDKTEIYRVTDSFFGQDFIWSYLGNFGGGSQIAGNVKDVSSKLDKVWTDSKGCCTGVGCTLEALDVNPQVYEYVLSRGWQRAVCDSVWFERLADRHLGKADTDYREAWNILYDKVQKQLAGHFLTVITARPNFRGRGQWTKYEKSYPNVDLLDAWGHICAAKPTSAPSYRFDCVNVARQCIENYWSDVFLETLDKYKAGDTDAFKTVAPSLLEAIDDLERLVSSDRYFLLGRWIAEARSWGDTPELQDYYEHDARNLLSCWGAVGGNLTDYANRAWAGLYSTLYKPRWEELFRRFNSGEKFNERSYISWCEDFELNWISDRTKFSSEPTGDPVKLSREMYAKYRDRIAALGK